MIVLMTTTGRLQQRYDHRLQDLVQGHWGRDHRRGSKGSAEFRCEIGTGSGPTTTKHNELLLEHEILGDHRSHATGPTQLPDRDGATKIDRFTAQVYADCSTHLFYEAAVRQIFDPLEREVAGRAGQLAGRPGDWTRARQLPHQGSRLQSRSAFLGSL
jgi:hypothetical protein